MVFNEVRRVKNPIM